MVSKLTTLANQKSSAEIQTMSKDSLKWMKSKISDLVNPANVRAAINREEFRQKNTFGLGGLYCFYYNPIGKKDLPYMINFLWYWYWRNILMVFWDLTYIIYHYSTDWHF